MIFIQIIQITILVGVISMAWNGGLAIPLIPDLRIPEGVPYLAFCKDNTYFLFTNEACPGGVRFLKSTPGDIIARPKPNENHNYAYAVRLEFCHCNTAPYQLLSFEYNEVIFYSYNATLGTPRGLDRPCQLSSIRIRGQDNSNVSEYPTETIIGIFPLTGSSGLEETIVFPVINGAKQFANYTKLRRLDVHQLRLSNQATNDLVEFDRHFSRPLARFDEQVIIWSNPPTVDGDCLLFVCPNKTTISPTELRHGESKSKVWATIAQDCSIYYHQPDHSAYVFVSRGCTIRNGLENYTIDPAYSAGLGRFSPIDESIKDTCELPKTCTATPDSIQMRPPIVKWTNLTPKQIQEKLTKEAIHLGQYRLRIIHQNARIRKPAYYPLALTIIELCVGIFRKLSSNLKSPSAQLIDLNFKLFEYLYYDQDDRARLPERQFIGIRYALEKCGNFLRAIPSTKFVCPVQKNTSDIKRLKPVPHDRWYYPTKHDMIIDLVWKTVDVAIMACSPYFSFDPLLHHIFGVEMMEFFRLEAIQIRWFRSFSPQQQTAFHGILPGLNVETLMRSDEVVKVVVNQNNVYHNSLRKPFREVRKPHPTKRQTQGDQEECPPERVIWGGEACCLDYNDKDGIKPPYPIRPGSAQW